MAKLFPFRPETQHESAGPRLVDLDDEVADDVFAALSSDTARRILSRLYRDPATASDVAEAADTSLQNARYHLDKLESAGLIEPVDILSDRSTDTFRRGTTPVGEYQPFCPIVYANVDGHQVLGLPYAEADVDMVILLPAEGQFRSFEGALDASRLADLLDATESRVGDLALPRFQFRSALSLPEYLPAMGMERAFTDRANFTGMATGETGERLLLDDIRHEATITVNERGTKAAAATGVEVIPRSGLVGPDPFDMTVDRPFLFAVRHRPTNAVLFLGRVVDAGDAQP